MLRKVGKKAQRNSERPNIVSTPDGNTTTDPETVAETFRKEWDKLYSNKTSPKTGGMAKIRQKGRVRIHTEETRGPTNTQRKNKELEKG